MYIYSAKYTSTSLLHTLALQPLAVERSLLVSLLLLHRCVLGYWLLLAVASLCHLAGEIALLCHFVLQGGNDSIEMLDLVDLLLVRGREVCNLALVTQLTVGKGSLYQIISNVRASQPGARTCIDLAAFSFICFFSSSSAAC